MIIKKYLKYLVYEKNIYDDALINMIEYSYHSGQNHSYMETYLIIQLKNLILSLES